MSVPYSTEFGRLNFADAGVLRVLGTVPAGKVWVIKDVSNVGLATGTSGCRWQYRQGGVPTPFWVSPALTLNQSAHTNSRQIVLTAGGTIECVGHSLTGVPSLYARAGGYELDA